MSKSALACPVCKHPKNAARHLTCSSCWSAVPTEDQHAIYALQRRERGSNRHKMHCRKVLRALHEDRRAVLKSRP